MLDFGRLRLAMSVGLVRGRRLMALVAAAAATVVGGQTTTLPDLKHQQPQPAPGPPPQQQQQASLVDGRDIWYVVFVWCVISSILLYTLAAGSAFFTLGKHKFGRFYSLMILVMGFVIPLTLGMVSSASIAFVYKTSSFHMDYTHAMMWGIGQTLLHAAFGLTRILATL